MFFGQEDCSVYYFMSTRDIGIFAENIAQKYLQDKGYKILDLNYKRKFAEIDIIAEIENKIVFCEVKANLGNAAEIYSPEKRVDLEKFKKLAYASQMYINDRGLMEKEWQIDIISVVVNPEIKKAKIRHFKNINFL